MPSSWVSTILPGRCRMADLSISARSPARVSERVPVFSVGMRLRRNALYGWILGMVVLTAWLVAMYPTVRARPEFKDLLDKYPKEILAFFGGGTGLDISSPNGYLRMELISFMAPLLVLVLGIGAGASAVAGEEEAGTLDLVLSRPIRRSRLVLEKLAVVVASVSVLGVVLFISMIVGAFATGMHLALSRLAAASVAVWAVGCFFGIVALGVGAATGRRGLAIALATVAAVAAYIVDSVGNLVSGIRPLKRISPYSLTVSKDPLTTGFHPGATLLVFAVAAAFLFVCAHRFNRRDISV
jgi:ABC-2 type transport system permease protein